MNRSSLQGYKKKKSNTAVNWKEETTVKCLISTLLFVECKEPQKHE